MNPTEKVAGAAFPPGLALVADDARSGRRTPICDIDNPQQVVTPITGHLTAQRADKANADGGPRRETYSQEPRPAAPGAKKAGCVAQSGPLAMPRQDVGKRNPVKLAIDHTLQRN